MLGSAKERILASIFRVRCVPQEPKSPLVKHGQVARYNIVEFPSALTKDTGANYSLTFDERFYRRHNVSPLQATLVCESYSLTKRHDWRRSVSGARIQILIAQPNPSTRNRKQKCLTNSA